MNRSELIEIVATAAGLSNISAAKTLDALVAAIMRAVAKGDNVTLAGFGKFKSSRRAGRVGRNPRTGREFKIAEAAVPQFIAGANFSDAVAGKKAATATAMHREKSPSRNGKHQPGGSPTTAARTADRSEYERRQIDAEILDSFDEELEMELDDERMNALVSAATLTTDQGDLERQSYFKELFRLQGELVKLQDWVVHKKLKVVVLFEGRDAAGKGGVIKRITQRLNPRVCRVAALPAPSERERSQWYFQRYVSHLPAGGEIVLFDRSWYNRAGVEIVMGFCNDNEYEEFFRTVPEFEKMLIRSGIILIKYWFSITDDEQHLRFLMRIRDPLKQWKLSPMDMESRRLWEQYTRAKETMLERTHIAEAPWWIVEAVDKKKARLNCIHHLLSQVAYEEIEREPVTLPERVHNPNYLRHPVPREMFVPTVY